MSDDVQPPEPSEDSEPARPRKRTSLYVIGLGLSVVGLFAAKSMYGDGNQLLAYFVLAMIGVIWIELGVINVRDRNRR
jgi:hypothetical protein